MPVLNITQVTYHRNGVSGTGFYAVMFTEDIGAGEPLRFVASVFPEPGDISVLNIDMLQTVGASSANAWRGDFYEPDLREAVREHCRSLYGPTDEELALSTPPTVRKKPARAMDKL